MINVSPVIHTCRLTLRRLQPSDAKAVFDYRSLPQVKCYQLWEPSSVAEVEEFIENLAAVAFRTEDSWLQFAIILSIDNTMIGDCGIYFVPGKSNIVQIGITLAPDHQRQGYALETLEGLFKYIFGELGIDRVEGIADARNAPSIRLMEHAGMKEDTCRRQKAWVKGEWVQEITYWIGSKTWKERPVL